MLNQLVRYAPVLRLLAKEPGTILEVGSGQDGISAYLRRPVIGCEIRFPGPPGRYLAPVAGSATALPFGDESIDVVLVMDTLEHIPAPQRAQALGEAMRVARTRIIIGGPMGERARTADDELAAFYRARGLTIPDWLHEHLIEGAPEISDVVEPLRAAGWIVDARGNENAGLHLALMKAESKRLGYRALGRIRRHAPAAAAAVARRLSFGPYYSYLVDATRSQVSSSR